MILPDKIKIPDRIQKLVCGKRFELNDPALLEIMKQARKKISRELMIIRDEKGLSECLRSIESLIFALKETEVKNDRLYFEVRNVLLVGKLIALNAMNRDKSLGSHYLSDYSIQ